MNLMEFFRALGGARGDDAPVRTGLGDFFNALLPSGTSARELDWRNAFADGASVGRYTGPMAPGTSPENPGGTTPEGITSVAPGLDEFFRTIGPRGQVSYGTAEHGPIDYNRVTSTSRSGRPVYQYLPPRGQTRGYGGVM